MKYTHLRPLFSLTVVALSLISNSINAEEVGNATPITAASDKKSDISEEDKRLQEMVNSAFNAAQTEQLPLNPTQINQFQKKLDDAANAINPQPAPKMVSRTQNVSLAPGNEPVSLRMSPGYVSSIVVTDSTGAPWAITSCTVGNKNWFSVVRPETGANNMLTVNALKNHVSSNMAITLKDRDAPLIVQLVLNDSYTDGKPQEADMIVSMRMNQAGPNATPPVIGAKITSSVSTELMSFLDGVPLPTSKPLMLKDAPEGVQAWEYNNQMYVRSIHLARWPAWIQQASSSTGTYIYVMPLSSQFIVSIEGQSRTINVRQ